MDPVIQLRTGPATPLLNPTPHPSLHGLRTIRGAASIQAFLHILLETAVPHPPPTSNNPDHVRTGTISLITQPLLGHSPGLRPPRGVPDPGAPVFQPDGDPREQGPLAAQTPDPQPAFQGPAQPPPRPCSEHRQAPGSWPRPTQQGRHRAYGLLGKVVLDTCVWGGVTEAKQQATADSAVWDSHSTKHDQGWTPGGDGDVRCRKHPGKGVLPGGAVRRDPGSTCHRASSTLNALSGRGDQRHARVLGTGEPGKQALHRWSGLLGVRRQAKIPGASVNSGAGGGLQEFSP